jgi:hypothetical protein
MHGFEIKEGRVFYANQKAARELENYVARHGGYVCASSTSHFQEATSSDDAHPLRHPQKKFHVRS